MSSFIVFHGKIYEFISILKVPYFESFRQTLFVEELNLDICKAHFYAKFYHLI